MQDAKDKTIKELARDCRTVDDVHILLRDLFRDTLQTMLEAEMDVHLGYDKNSVVGNNLSTTK